MLLLYWLLLLSFIFIWLPVTFYPCLHIHNYLNHSITPVYMYITTSITPYSITPAHSNNSTGTDLYITAFSQFFFMYYYCSVGMSSQVSILLPGCPDSFLWPNATPQTLVSSLQWVWIWIPARPFTERKHIPVRLIGPESDGLGQRQNTRG
jgi:hypothetical protein